MPEVRRRSRRSDEVSQRALYPSCACCTHVNLPTLLTWYLLRAVLLRTTIHTSPFGCNLLQSTDRPQSPCGGPSSSSHKQPLSVPTHLLHHALYSACYLSGPNGGCGGRFASAPPRQSPTRPVQSLHLQPRRQEAPPTPRQTRGRRRRGTKRGGRRLSPPKRRGRHPCRCRSHQRRGRRHPRRRSAWRQAAQTPRWRWGWRSRRSWWRRPTCRRWEWRTTPHRSPRQTRAQT